MKKNIRKEKALLNFARQVVPKNWNIFLDRSNYKEERGALNIYLTFSQDTFKTKDFTCNLEVDALGLAEGIRFFAFSSVGEVNIKINTEADSFDTMLHELAHVAVNRWVFFKYRSEIFRSHFSIIYTESLIIDFRRIIKTRLLPHGRIFKKAYHTFKTRSFPLRGIYEEF